MSNPTRIGQEAPDLKTPSSPSRITPTTKPPEPKYPYAVDDDGFARVGYVTQAREPRQNTSHRWRGARRRRSGPKPVRRRGRWRRARRPHVLVRVDALARRRPFVAPCSRSGLGMAIFVVFSIFTQAAEGTTFASSSSARW